MAGVTFPSGPDPKARRGIPGSLSIRPILCLLLAAVALVHANPAPAQAPDRPVSTTTLEPVDAQTGSGIPDGLPTPPPEDRGTDFLAIPGTEGTGQHGEMMEDASRSETGDGSETAETPRGTDRSTARRIETAEPSATAASGTGIATEQDVRSQDPQGAGNGPASSSGEAAAPAPSGTTARALLTGLWREAVATGETTQGFEAWLGEALGRDSPATRERVEIPADQAGRTRLVSERWRTRAGPVALGAAGRVVTTFGSAIPTAFCAPLTVCYIELEPGEFLTSTPSWGDTVRWQVLVKSQGRDPATVVIEVKPAEDAQLTNLVIPTDRRLYTINLVNDPEVHTPILSFLYPDSAARKIVAEIAAREAREAEAKAAQEQRRAEAASARAADLKRNGVQTATGNVSADRLDFGFRVDGKAPFRPVRVFADGRRTYIDLHPAYRGALPVIIAGPGEANKALNTRVAQDGGRLVADRVIADIWLQSGKKRVRIRRAAR